MIKCGTLMKKMQNVSCFSRARLGKHVTQMVEQVKEIIEQGRVTGALVIDNPSTAGVAFQLEHLEGETIVKEDIWKYLMGDEIGMIGVCGMGGIGKTTIMKHRYNQLLKEVSFDKIIWVTVSKELNITNLQNDIANEVGVVALPDPERQRVAVLMEELGGRRYVLILDDVWEKFSLLKVGIPKPASYNRSKLVLISRSIEVCRSMDCEIIQVPKLSDGESMNLFLEHVGHGVLKVPSLNEILHDIVQECDGLPLAIAVIGGSMKEVHEDAEWRNALRELRDHIRTVKGTDVEIYERLKFSFDRLRDVNIQNCFLYCSLYPEDYTIPREELMEYWIYEEFLGTGRRQQLYDRGHTILNRLVNNCLLEKVAEDNVRMHDVIRDMAFYIKPNFMVKAGTRLNELPSKKDWKEDLERVSFMRNNVSEIPSHLSPSCENLSTLLLQNNEFLESIPDSFFQHMHNLSILDLSYTSIKQLPNTVSNMEKLIALVLRECKMLRHVPSLEKLKALRKLDLRHTAIEEVPEGLEMLVNLTYLNLCAKNLKELPMAILHSSSLQCLILYIETSILKMDGSVAARLRNLEIFQGRFLELIDFNTYWMSVKAQRLISYSLVVAPPGAKLNVKKNDQVLVIQIRLLSNSTVPKVMEVMDAHKGVEYVYFDPRKGRVHVVGRMIDAVNITLGLRKKLGYAGLLSVKHKKPRLQDLLPKKEVILSGSQIQKEEPVVLPTDLRFLRIHECHNMRSLSDMSLFFQQTNELRLCTVEDCEDIESVLDLSFSSSPCNTLENLEYLWLESLAKLHVLVKVGEASVISSITTTIPMPGIFSRLKSFVIVDFL